jgi:hypothetical protein
MLFLLLLVLLVFPPSSGYKPAWNVATALRSHRIHKKYASTAAAKKSKAIPAEQATHVYDLR